MHHKRRKPKSSRAGCLMCKPHKHQRVGKMARLKAKFRAMLDSRYSGLPGHLRDWMASVYAGER